MRKVYDDAVKQMGGDEEVRARHILVPTEDEAKTILADLKKGGNFETIAKEKSKDPGAAAQGGDLGYFTKDQMVPEFAEVAFKLEKGALSDPVKSQFGWHIIKVEDKRSKSPPPFEQVKDQVETFVQRKAQAEYVTKLREGAKVERLDKPAEQASSAVIPERAARRDPESIARRIAIDAIACVVMRFRVRRCRGTPGNDDEYRHGRSRSSLPPRPDQRPRHAGDRRRQARDRRGRHQIRQPHRRAAGAARSGHRGGGRVHPVEVPVGAGGMVPRQSQERQAARAGGQLRQRQRLHRQDRTRRPASSPPRSRRAPSAASRATCSSPRPA